MAFHRYRFRKDGAGMKGIGSRLQALRVSRSLTSKQVARSIAVAESTYRAWEAGRAITGEPYLALAELFGVSVYELLSGKRSTGADEFRSAVEQVERGIEKLKGALNRLS
jgi:transcriptional regulator with XRE-family HTH domain